MPTFGKLTNSGTIAGNGDRCWVMKATCIEIGTATDVFVHMTESGSPGTMNIKGVIYAVSAGEPAALLAVSNAVSLTTGSGAGFKQCTLVVPLALTATDYYIGCVAADFQWECGFNVDVGELRRKESFTYASPADPFGTPAGSTAESMAAYVSYTTGSAAILGRVTNISKFPKRFMRPRVRPRFS